MLKLSWLPDRTCIIRYQGNGSFNVVSSEITRVAKDDTFECRHVIKHEPAYLYAWKHGDDEPVTYVIGKKNGIIAVSYTHLSLLEDALLLSRRMKIKKTLMAFAIISIGKP